MRMLRHAAGHSAPARAPRPPVVVSFDAQGELLDVVGDIDRFIAGEDGREDVFRRLQDLRGGAPGVPARVPALELSSGRYADVDVVEEEDGCHFVLRDATELMRAQQRRQQSAHELELREAAQRKAMLRGGEPVSRNRGLQPYRRGAELFAALAEEMRAPLGLLGGHAQLLEKRLGNDPAALRSLAAIRHAAVRLEAMANNALFGLGGEPGAPGVLELAQLAALLEQNFALPARAQGVMFEIRLPKREAVVEVDDLALRQLLINLLIHALDGLESGALTLTLGVASAALEIELGRSTDDESGGGFDAARFGALVTSSDLLQQTDAAGSYALATSQLLLRRLRAKVELVPRNNGGHELWLRVPVVRAAPEPGQLHAREIAPAPSAPGERIAVVAVEPAAIADLLVELLAGLGVPALAVTEATRVEALLRDGAVALLVLSGRFDGQSGHAFAEQSGIAADVALLLLDQSAPADQGWRHDGRSIRASVQADRDTLHAALAAALGG